MKKSPSQTDRLYNLLLDKKPHRTDEILKKVYGSKHLGIARIGARIYDIKQKYGLNIECKKDKKKKTLHWYKLV